MAYDPFSFGTHWHNVFLIFLVAVAGSIALIDTIGLFRNGTTSLKTAKTVILWIFTVVGAVWLGMHIKDRSVVPGTQVPVEGRFGKDFIGLHKDPLDFDPQSIAVGLIPKE